MGKEGALQGLGLDWWGVQRYAVAFLSSRQRHGTGRHGSRTPSTSCTAFAESLEVLLIPKPRALGRSEEKTQEKATSIPVIWLGLPEPDAA